MTAREMFDYQNSGRALLMEMGFPTHAVTPPSPSTLRRLTSQASLAFGQGSSAVLIVCVITWMYIYMIGRTLPCEEPTPSKGGDPRTTSGLAQRSIRLAGGREVSLRTK